LGRNIRNSPEPFLGRLFGVDPQWFMNMQSKYDLRVQAERLADELAAIQPPTAA
jgi:plasmid maintenance system antidote protein VapI